MENDKQFYEQYKQFRLAYISISKDNIISKIEVFHVFYSLISAIYQVLLYDNQTLFVTLALSLIQLFQLIYLSFAIKTVYLWQDNDFASYINQFLGYFTILKHIVNTEFEIFLGLLYFSFSLIIITIILIFLVGIMDKEAPIILVKLLGYIIKFLLTIGYFPLMQIFFGYLACHYNNGSQIMVYLKQQACWTSNYAIHSTFAILGLILSQSLISLLVLICYQSKQTHTNTFSQRTGRSYQFYHYTILINIMTYQLLDTPQYISVIITVFLLTSYYFFHIIKNTQPFHHKKVQTVWVIIAAINFWTNFMLAFAAILEGQYFGKSLYAWLIGIPFLTIIILREPAEQIDLFAANINPHEDGDKIIQLCEYLLNMIQTAGSDFYVQLELDAYVEVHRHACPKPDCVLKNKKQNERKKPSRQGNQILLDVINQIFYYGIKSFPTDIHLRLHYAYFLIDYLKAKQLALTELQQAEQSNDSYDFTFIIFRFKKIIEEEIQLQQQDNAVQLDLSNEMSFLAQSKELFNTVEKTALLFIDFWSQLQEEIPDTGKLLYIGQKIQYLSSMVESQWKRIRKLNQKHKKLYLLMGKYYQQVWNDEIKSQQLFEIEKHNKNSEFKGLYILEEMGSSPQAILVCYTEGESLGIIQSINKAASSLLGYTKTDLVGRHLNILQPDIYSRQHTTIMSKFLENNEQGNEMKEQVSKVIFAKTKSHYIIQCSLLVKIIQTQNQEIFLMAQMQQDIQFRPFCFLICQQNGQIDNINSMCVKVLGIDNKILELRRLNINDLFPNFMDLKEDYQTRQGEKLIYTPSSKLSKDLEFQKQSQENIAYDFKESLVFNCQVSEIYFSTLNTQSIENRVFGYIIRLEQIKKQTNPLQMQRKLSQQSLCFKFTPQNFYSLEKMNITDTNENSIRIDSSIIWESAQKQTDDSITQEIKIQKPEDVKGLGFGIRTVRLLNDKIVEIEDCQPEEDDEESQHNQIMQQQEDQDEEQSVMQQSHFQSKQSIEVEIKQSKIPKINIRMQIFINFLLVIIIVCTFLEYFLGVEFNDQLSTSLPYLRQNNERIAVFLLLQSVIEDLKFISYGYQPLQQALTNNSYYFIQRTNFMKNLLLIEDLQYNLSLAQTSFISDYSQYEDDFKSTIVQMQDVYGNKQNYTISEAIQQTISIAIALNDTNVTQFKANNSQLFYFEYNSYNSLAIHQNLSQYYYFYNILSKTSIANLSVNIFLIAVSLIAILLFLIQSCYFYQIHHSTQEIIQLFLDIKDVNIKEIYYACELFLTELQIGDDDLMSEMEEKPIEKNEELMLNFRPKRRKHKDSIKKLQNHLTLGFSISLLIFFYFFFLYFESNTVQEQVNRILPILNATSYAECYSRFTDNALRQFLFDPTFPIYNQNGLDEIKKIIVQLYDIDAAIHDLHTETWDLLEDTYKQAFFDIYINNPCAIIASMDSSITEDACDTFYSGIIVNGLSIGMTKFIEDLRITVANYENRNISEKQKYQLSSDPEQNFRINLLNTASLASIRRMQKILIRACYKYLIQIMEQTIITHFDNTDLIRLAVFLSINVVLFIVITLIWIPIQLQNSKDIIQTRLLILIIPLDLILRIKSIKNYLRNKIFH